MTSLFYVSVKLPYFFPSQASAAPGINLGNDKCGEDANGNINWPNECGQMPPHLKDRLISRMEDNRRDHLFVQNRIFGLGDYGR